MATLVAWVSSVFTFALMKRQHKKPARAQYSLQVPCNLLNNLSNNDNLSAFGL